jgi:hypothetical protein
LLIQAPGGERWRSGWVAHEALGPGGVGGVQDLAAGSVGLLGEAVVDASDSTAFRLIDRIAGEPGLLDAIRAARAASRERAWELGVRPERIVIDIDATLITAHTEKQGAAVNYKSGFGFHPILAYLDESHEALAGVLRPGGAPAHSAQAQIDVLDLALAQLPVGVVGDLDTEIVMRIDSAGAAGALCQAAQDANIGFLVGFDLFTGVREAILLVPEDAWRPAIRQDGEERDGAQVAEITHVERLDLTPWPDRSRVILRRERPHPGAQLKFTDADGHRFQATLTDLAGDAVQIECLHRGRGDAENLVRAAKQTGLENLPFREFALQCRLARAHPHRAGPDRLDPESVPDRRAGRLRTKSASLPAAAHRRQALVSRPPRGPAPPSQLAMGRAARRRVRATP